MGYSPGPSLGKLTVTSAGMPFFMTQLLYDDWAQKDKNDLTKQSVVWNNICATWFFLWLLLTIINLQITAKITCFGY